MAASKADPICLRVCRSQGETFEVDKKDRTTNINGCIDEAAESAQGANMKKVTLISALHNKYSVSSMQSVHCQIFIASNAPGKTASGNFRVPENLALDSCDITSSGLQDDIIRLCSDVRELDLAQNHIEYWEEVFILLETLPKLEFLNLTKNPLAQLTAVDEKRYHKLKKLVLNFTNLTWGTIENLLTIMPNLEELYLSGNSYDDIVLDIPAYDSLRLLQLTENKFNDWSYVLKIDKVFPKLNTLILAHNSITSCGSVEENSSIFRSLRVLNMNNTLISEWDELDKLSAIKSVSDIRLHTIPLVQDYEELMRRQLVVVYFPHASRINGSAISNTERETAERVYLRNFQTSPSKPLRYTELVNKHGNVDPLANVNLQPANTVAMTVICEEREELFDIPTKQTIGQLKTSLKAFVGTKKFRLFHDDKIYQGPTEIRTNNRFVWALNFRDGETLICVKIEKPVSPSNSQPTSPIKSQPRSTTKPQRVNSRRPIRKEDSSSIENLPPSPTKEPPPKKR